MAITGGLKLFKKSKCAFSEGASMVATSGDASSPNAIDRNFTSYWRSVGSTDAITETLIVNLVGNVTIDRIFLIDHNFKSYNVKYLSGGTYTHFSNVVGIDGSMANITESTYARDTSYYEFTPVTTTSLQIEVTTTQTVNTEKYLNLFIATEEMGTLTGFPKIKNLVVDRNIRKKEMLSGKSLILKSEESFSVELDFDSYPASSNYHADIDLAFSLFDIEDNFIIWLCGGRTGSNYFKKELRGFRLKDVYTVQLAANLKLAYINSTYKNPVDFTLKLEEVVD